MLIQKPAIPNFVKPIMSVPFKIALHFFLLTISVLAFGQPEPTLFQPGIISDGGVFGLTLSPDSKTALWVKSNGKRDTLIIMESTNREGRWMKPVVASFSTRNGEWKDIDPVFCPDGKTVLFQSTRPVQGKPNRTGFDIWMVQKTKNGWTTPVHLGNVINSDQSESFASMANNRNIYFMKENENPAYKSDLYVSEWKNGSYQTPKNIGAPINTTERESNPFISPKEDYLIYFSSSPEGLGEVDLYISFKTKSGWSSPHNLGHPINSALAEFCPFFHSREKRLYFARQKKGDRMMEDHYSVNFNPYSYLKKGQ